MSVGLAHQHLNDEVPDGPDREWRAPVGVSSANRAASVAGLAALGRRRWLQGKKSRAFGGDESISGDAQGGMVVKSSPTSPFEVVDADLVFEFLVIPLDPPTHMDGGDEFLQGRRARQIAEVVLGRGGLGCRPLDDQPFFRAQCRSVLTMCRMYADGSEARAHRLCAALPPGHGLPSRCRQFVGQGGGSDRSMAGRRP